MNVFLDTLSYIPVDIHKHFKTEKWGINLVSDIRKILLLCSELE